MSTRREGRECAVQLLFQWAFCHEDSEKAFIAYWAEQEEKSHKDVRKFTEELVRGVLERREDVDAMITRCADNWSISRIARLDLSVLRLGVYEILFCADIPAAVTINEAVDLAKYFSSRESGRFVNGVLDRVRKELDQGAEVS
ncbi:MAG: transcription antitermination factor NusB [Verrucomicrobia bacterium]|nr:transcription antitermination factor NusB [Verrucomicrobiota bacterium]MDA1085555.1 transcription antitermination factor NusB [Verrucomicrobiota bacterium]